MKVVGNEQMPDSFAVEEGPDLTFGTVMKAVEGEPHRALTSAILNGDVEAVKAFLKEPPSGFDFNSRSYRGLNSPVPLLHLAITAENANRIEILRLLLDDPRIDLTTVPPDNVTSLGVKHASALTEAQKYHAWRQRPDTAQVVKMVEAALSKALISSSAEGNEEQAVKLIKAGADPKAGDDKGLSVLAFAADHFMPDLVKAIVDALPAGERKAFVNKPQLNGYTAIQAAALKGDHASYDTLLAAGADENAQSPNGSSALAIKNAIGPRGPGSNKGSGHNVFDEMVSFAWGLTIFSGIFRVGPSTPPQAPSLPEVIRANADRLNRMLGTNFWITANFNPGQVQSLQIGSYRIEGWELPEGATGGGIWSTTQQREYINARLEEYLIQAQTESGRRRLPVLFDPSARLIINRPAIATGRNADRVRMTTTRADGIVVYRTGDSGYAPPRPLPQPGWGRPENTPSDLVGWHEDGHALQGRALFGMNQDQTNAFTNAYFTVNGIRVHAMEASNVGLGPFRFQPDTDIDYAHQRGIRELRNYYDSPTEIGPEGLWGSPTDFWNRPGGEWPTNWWVYNSLGLPLADPDNSDFTITDDEEADIGLQRVGPRDVNDHRNLTWPDATEQAYEDGLNTLAVKIVNGMDFNTMTMTDLMDQTLAPQFRSLVVYALNHNGVKVTPGQPIDERVMYEAFDKVITALRTRVWNAANNDKKDADNAATIFNIYWDQKKGSDKVDTLVRQAWYEWREANGVPIDKPRDAGSPDATQQDYDATLKALIDRIVKSMDFDKKTMAKLTSENLEGLFRSLITYELNRSEKKLEKDYQGSETYWKVFHKVMNAVDEALPKAFDDKKKAEAGKAIFSDYWQNGGADEADELVQRACKDWLKKHGG